MRVVCLFALSLLLRSLSPRHTWRILNQDSWIYFYCYFSLSLFVRWNMKKLFSWELRNYMAFCRNTDMFIWKESDIILSLQRYIYHYFFLLLNMHILILQTKTVLFHLLQLYSIYKKLQIVLCSFTLFLRN